MIRKATKVKEHRPYIRGAPKLPITLPCGCRIRGGDCTKREDGAYVCRCAKVWTACVSFQEEFAT